MLYSQMLSGGSNQTLYANDILGEQGILAKKPDFKGYALGDLLRVR